MLLWLLNNRKLMTWIAATLALISLFLLINHWRHQANLYESAKEELASCQASAKLTKELNDGLQKSRDTINSRLADLKRVRPNSCVSIRPNAIEGGQEYAGRNGEVAGSSDDFRDFAAVCETFRTERIALEQYLGKYP